MHPTLSPSIAPTTPAPTLAPTEICEAILAQVGAGGAQMYNGLYNKATGTINGMDWYVARDDVGGTAADTQTTLYYSTSHERWVIEAPDVYWEANQTQHSFGVEGTDYLNAGNDKRMPAGIQDYFGKNEQMWFQFSLDHGSTTVGIQKHRRFMKQ